MSDANAKLKPGEDIVELAENHTILSYYYFQSAVVRVYLQ